MEELIIMEELIKKMCELYPQTPKEEIEFHVAMHMLYL
jgi:hypothetical protein